MASKAASNTQMAVVEDVDLSVESIAAFQQFGAYNNFRTIPNVIDGLKPGARRVIWGMFKNGYTPNKGTNKSASVVGDIMKYHPHGDSGIYTSMVTMAHVPSEGRSVKLYSPLLHGQGGWGDLENPASAPRYTECRLNEYAMSMLGSTRSIEGEIEVNQEAVDMVPNYDGKKIEPTVLPAMLPNWVINGVEGIGIGIATDAPSHNIGEVLDLAIRMVDNPNPRWSTIQSVLLGPDMACDAIIYDGPEGRNIQSYMETGYGSFVMRAKYEIEPYVIDKKRTGHQMVITGLPYRISPTHVLGGVARMVADGNLPAVTAADYSTATGYSVVIDFGEHDKDDVEQRLLAAGKSTGLQVSISVFCNANVNGNIQTIGTIDGLRLWIDHRRVVIRRRSQFRLDGATARLEIVEGFLKAVPIANELVSLIRAADDKNDAAEQMQQKYGFTDNQARAILEMTLGQITKLGVDRYETEAVKLQEVIDECTELLNNPVSLDKRLKAEMRAVRNEYGAPRRCELRLDEDSYVAKPTAPAVEVPAVHGLLARTGKGMVRWFYKRSRNPIVGNDHIVEYVKITDQNMFEGISSMGYHYRIGAGAVPEKWVKADGLFPLDQGETLVLANSGLSVAPGCDIVMVTEYGHIKRVAFDVYGAHREGKYTKVISMDDGDSVKHAFFLPEGADIALVTGYGKMLRIDADNILAKGRGAKGNPGIRLQGGEDSVVWAGAITDEDDLTYWTSQEQVGWFSAADVKQGGRNTQGATITRSNNLIKGVVKGGGNVLSWFHGQMDVATTLELSGQSSGTNLSDRQLKLTADEIEKANAVWLDTSAEDDVEE